MALQVKPVQSSPAASASRITASSGARGVASTTRPEVDALSTDFNVGSQDEQVLQQDYSFGSNAGQREHDPRSDAQAVAFAYELHESEEARSAQGTTFSGIMRRAGQLPSHEIARGVAIYENNMNTIANGGRSTGRQLSYAI
ncbi:MAG: hypothetical protein RJQ21_17720 [Rhodospirillales bacterium]